VPILKQRARGPLAWAGTRCYEQAGGQGEAAAVGRETAEINRHSRRQLGGRTDDLIGFRAANVAFTVKKNGVDGEKSG
jgi:hypothetical protein